MRPLPSGDRTAADMAVRRSVSTAVVRGTAGEARISQISLLGRLSLQCVEEGTEGGKSVGRRTGSPLGPTRGRHSCLPCTAGCTKIRGVLRAARLLPAIPSRVSP